MMKLNKTSVLSALAVCLYAGCSEDAVETPFRCDLEAVWQSAAAWGGPTANDSFVYWHDGTTVYRVSNSASDVETLYERPQDDELIVRLAVTEQGNLYISEIHDGIQQVFRINNGSKELVGTGRNTYTGIHPGDSTIYWCSSAGLRSPEHVISPTCGSTRYVYGNPFIYFADGGAIYRVLGEASAASSLIHQDSTASVEFLRYDASGSLYWLSEPDAEESSVVLKRSSDDGSQVETIRELSATRTLGVGGFEVHEDFAYILWQDTSTLERVHLTTGESEVISSQESGYKSLYHGSQFVIGGDVGYVRVPSGLNDTNFLVQFPLEPCME